jgi:hypothetical protein
MKTSNRLSALLAVLLLLGCAPATTGAQGDIVLTVKGDVDKPFTLNSAQFAALARVHVSAVGHDSVAADYEGVPLQEVLRRAGVKFGADLYGPRVVAAVIVGAADGYRAVFAVPELDSLFTGRVVLLADRRNGKPNSASEGRLRIIIPGERRFPRWVRQVTSLTVKNL